MDLTFEKYEQAKATLKSIAAPGATLVERDFGSAVTKSPFRDFELVETFQPTELPQYLAALSRLGAAALTPGIVLSAYSGLDGEQYLRLRITRRLAEAELRQEAA